MSPSYLGLSSCSLHASEGEADKSRIQRHKWKNSILRSISIMDAVLNAASRNDAHHDFEGEVSAILGEDPFEDYHHTFANQDGSSDRLAITLRPAEGSARLNMILRQHLPNYRDYSSSAYKAGCRPSFVVRYWLPATILLVCHRLSTVMQNSDCVYSCHQPHFFAILRAGELPLRPGFVSLAVQ